MMGRGGQKRWALFPGALGCVLALLLITCQQGPRTPRRGEIAFRPVSFGLRDMKFPSGLRVLVEEDHSRPLTAVAMVVGVGSAQDPAGRQGLAHLVEHLTFRARPDGQATIGQVEDYVGAISNATTGFDATTYFSVAPVTMVEHQLRIEAERLKAPLLGLEQTVFDVEREVVRNELRQRNETGVYGGVLEKLQSMLFPKQHPYSRGVAGTHESLTAITLADAERLVATYYRPDNTTIVISGDLDLKTTDALVQMAVPAELLAKKESTRALPKSRQPKARPPVPAPNGPEFASMEAAVPEPQLWVAWSLPRDNDAEAHLNTLTSSLTIGRLLFGLGEKKVVEDMKLAYFGGQRASILAISISLRDHSEELARDIADDVRDAVYDIFRLSGSFQNQLAEVFTKKLKRSVSAQLTLGTDQRLPRLFDRAMGLHFSGDPAYFGRQLEAINQADHSTLSKFVGEYVTRERTVALFVRPFSDLAAEEQADAGHHGALEPPPSGLAREASEAQNIVLASTLGSSEMFRLKNGLEVVVDEEHSFPVAAVGLVLSGGAASGSQLGVPEIAGLFGERGSSIQGSLFDFGGSLRTRLELDSVRFIARSPGGNAPNLLAILEETVSSRQVRSAVVIEEKAKVFSFLEKQQDYPPNRAEAAFRRALFGDHPYGRTALVADLEKVEVDNVAEWLEAIASGENGVLAISGDVKAADIKAFASDSFGDWDPSDDKSAKRQKLAQVPPFVEPVPQKRPIVLTERQPGASQAILHIGCLLPEATPRSRVTYDLLARLVAQTLNDEVRADTGASYGVYASADALRGGTAWLEVTSVIAKSRAETSLAAIRRHWDLLLDEIDLTKLDWARWTLAKDRNLLQDTSAGRVELLLTTRALGWPLASIDEYGATLAKLGAGDVQAAFRVCHAHAVVSLISDANGPTALKKAGW